MPYLTVTREAHDLIYRCCLRERDWADSSKEVDGGMLVLRCIQTVQERGRA